MSTFFDECCEDVLDAKMSIGAFILVAKNEILIRDLRINDFEKELNKATSAYQDGLINREV